MEEVAAGRQQIAGTLGLVYRHQAVHPDVDWCCAAPNKAIWRSQMWDFLESPHPDLKFGLCNK